MRPSWRFPWLRCYFVWMDTMRDGAPLIDVVGADLGVIARSREYSLLGLEGVKQALARPPDQVSIHEDKWDDPCALRLRAGCFDANWTQLAPRGRHPCRYLLCPQSWRRA